MQRHSQPKAQRGKLDSIAMDCLMEQMISNMDADDMGWSGWSPELDWTAFAGAASFDDGDVDIVQSMRCKDEDYGLDGAPPLHEWSTSASASSAGTPTEDTTAVALDAGGEDDRGLRMVHLLMAVAEALSGSANSGDLAQVILARLKELVVTAAASGGAATSMVRLAAHFSDALQGILDGAGGWASGEANCPGDLLEAFRLLEDMSPYVKFGHFTANQAILEAVAGERRLHIVDYDVMEGAQWPSLMQALMSRNDGLPTPRLKITAVTGSGRCRRSAATVQETGRRLAGFAASIGLPFSFCLCRLDYDETFRPATVKTVKGEAVVLNCVINPPHLPHHAAASVGSFLAGATELGARLVTIVEEEASAAAAGGGGDGGDEGFTARFLDELQRYSAILDSLEAGFPMQDRARRVVEKVILGPRIAGAVGRAYRQRVEGEMAAKGWSERVEAAGFRRVGLSFFNLCQARLLLGLFNDGYRVEEEAPNKLVLCWKSCRLFSTSVWSAPAAAPPSALVPAGFSFEESELFNFY
ncbi:Nodulation-signaling pathway 2 protein [Apostasia shenzhenica]|uniref:Nodulation-signaling pathway 2 protein n=1 Tax=Apostasia shenzhenica TaxID=1088818 RepID=A0A2I0AVF2_9ASPA|nr:Nodulation-signaling pathway 2 protein [Apostasia shenzhenica]